MHLPSHLTLYSTLATQDRFHLIQLLTRSTTSTSHPLQGAFARAVGSVIACRDLNDLQAVQAWLQMSGTAKKKGVALEELAKSKAYRRHVCTYGTPRAIMAQALRDIR
jgi:hypothetical protein